MGESKDDLATWFWNYEDLRNEDKEKRRLKYLECAGIQLEEKEKSFFQPLEGDHLEEDEISEQKSVTSEELSWTLSSSLSFSSLSDEEIELSLESFDNNNYKSEGYETRATGNSKTKKVEKAFKTSLANKLPGYISEVSESDLVGDKNGFGEQFSQFMSRLQKMGIPSSDVDEGSESSSDNILSSESETEYIKGNNKAEDSSGWRRLCMLPDPWAEVRYPTEHLVSRQELSLEYQTRRVDSKIIASGLGNLTVPPGCTHYTCTKLQLQGMGIRNIEKLSKYKFLQYIDLAMNEIKDLSPIWTVRHLVVLDVSYNLLNEEEFGWPQNVLFLTYLNLSHNNFTKIPDLSPCWSLKHINFSQNKIKLIENLQTLEFLEYLNLSSNELESISNLVNPRLMEVDFSYNQLTDWNNPSPSSLANLKTVNVASNLISSLKIFKNMYSLRKFDASYNEISTMGDLEWLRTLPRLEDLRLHGNKIMTVIADARRLIIFYAPAIKKLDDSPISSRERVSSHSSYAMNTMDSMVVHNTLTFYAQHCQNPTTGWERLKPTGDHPAIILLVGVLGSFRENIIQRVINRNPYKAKVIRQVTTRPKVENHLVGISHSSTIFYKHVSSNKFYKMEERGDFVSTYLDLGYKFGIESEALENKDKVLLFPASLSAAQGLVWQGFRPITLLVFPEHTDVLNSRVCTWFRTTTIFRCDSHTMLLRGKTCKRNRRKSRRPRYTVMLYGEDAIDIPYRSISGAGIAANREIQAKRLSRRPRDSRKKMGRMITAAKSILHISKGKKKRLRKSFSINQFSNDRILRCRHKVFRDPIFRRNTEKFFNPGLSSPVSHDWCPSLDKKVLFKTKTTESQSGNQSGFSRETKDTLGCTSTVSGIQGESTELTRFVKNIIKLRLAYKEFHKKHPGFFRLYIPSDDPDAAAKELSNVVDEAYDKLMSHKKEDSNVLLNDSPYFEELVMTNINEYVNEIRTSHVPPDILQ